jgi:TonB-dependent receptor
MSNLPRTLLASVLGAFLALAFTAVLPSVALAKEGEAKKNYDLPAGDAAAMLKKFSEISGHETLFAADAVRGVKTAAVKGELTAIKALETLLADSGLTATQDAKTGAFAVSRSNGNSGPNVLRAAQNETSVRPSTIRTKDDGVVEMEAFKVEGQRAGQARALNRQRDAASFRNIVTSDSLGRFPDQNAAESLQRVTGVSLERDQGEGRFITIRGLDPDLNNTQLNGIALPAAGGIEEGARKVNLDVIASDLIESVEVTKAVTPDMDGDAIGGSVNIVSQTAFSQDGRVIRLSAEGQFGELTGDWGRKFSFTYADRFRDGKVGLLVSYSDLERAFGSDNRETAGPWVVKNSFLTPSNDIQVREYEIERQRRGASVSLDYRPTGQDDFFVRGLHNYFSDFENRYRTRFRGTTATATPSSDIAGTVAGRPVEVNLKDRFDESYLWTISAGGEHRRDGLTIDYKAAHSYSETATRNRSDSTYRSANTSWTYDFSDETRPVFGGTALTLPASAFAFNNIIFDNNRNQDETSSAEVNFKRAITLRGHEGFLKAGAKYRAREKDIDFNLATYNNASGGAFTLANVTRTSARGVNPAFPSVNPGAERAWFAANPAHFALNVPTTTLNSTINDYVSSEDVLAAYLQAEFKLTDRLTVIGGLRAERTRFETRGWEIQGANVGTLARTSAGRDYTDVLPSVVFRHALRPNLVARGSWTSTLARPKFSDSNLNRIIDADGNVTQGNPNLQPYQASNWDFSLEYFPKGVGVVSLGLFRKDIRRFVFTQRLVDALPGGADLELPLNGDRAHIQGLEAEWQYQFLSAPAPFDGFGFAVNVTLTDGEAKPGAARPGETIRFLGQSDLLYNAALTYEKNGLFLRLAANFRSDYILLYGGDRNSDVYVEDGFRLDASASYKFSDRITVFAEASNLTDDPFHASFDVSNRLRQAEYYSWSANLGVKLSY